MKTLTIDQLIERVDHIPRLPDTALRLIPVITDPASTLEQIVGCLRYDPVITAELLRLCNSAYFGLPRRIDCVDEAVRLLGTNQLLRLVLAASTRALLARPQRGYGLRPGALWEHSVGVALACQLLAERLRRPDTGMLYTAGLLHDIGKVVLNEYVANAYVQIAHCVAEGNISFLDAERCVLGFSHAEVGGRLAEMWNLPEPTVRCIRFHHEPDTPDEPDPNVDVVHLADATCLIIGIGGGEVDGLAYPANSTVLRRTGLNEKKLESIGADLVLQLKKVQELFALHV